MQTSGILSPFRYVLLFAVLLLTQVLICNNILLFGVAIPFIFIYFILVLPLNTGLNLLMGLAFMMGVLVDLFSDTLGLNALACLLLSVLKRPIYYAYMPKEDKHLDTSPGLTGMGWWNYLKYVLTMSAIYCFIIFGIELFSFASFQRILLMAASSTVFTVLLLLAADSIFNRKPE